LIARQRQNLAMTFAAESEQNHSAAVLQRLSTYENEIADATKELADGLMQRGEFVPDLEEALRAMLASATQLREGQLPAAVEAEQLALQHLIRARQNMRKMLSQSNSQAAAECRKFDRQQRQKLRTPEQVEKDRQQQLADARKQLNQLAQDQRQWSEELRQSNAASANQQPKPEGQKPDTATQKPESQNASQSQSQSQAQSQSKSQGQSQSKSSSSFSDGARSPTELAETQKKMLEALDKLREQLAQSKGTTPAGEQTTDLVEESMRRSLEELAAQRAKDAAQSGQKAADQLERLAEHLATMNARDFGERLERSQQLAEKLAGQQQKVSDQLAGSNKLEGDEPGEKTSGEKPTSGAGQPGASSSGGSAPLDEAQRTSAASRERELAAEAEMLHELLSALRADGLGEKTGVGRELDDAEKANPPTEAAQRMREAAESLDANRQKPATAAAQSATRQLQDLAGELKGIRGRFAQPQLEELLELESQIAQLQRQLQKGANQGQAERLAEQWQDLEPRLDQLASGDQRLAQALERLRNPSSEDADSSEPGTKPGDKPGSESGDKPGAKPGEKPGTNESGQGKPGSGSNSSPANNNSPVRSANQSENLAELPPGLYWMRLGGNSNLREVAKALQVKIQEAILAAALQDSDEPVPPEYKQLVDEYYKALSDDLR